MKKNNEKPEEKLKRLLQLKILIQSKEEEQKQKQVERQKIIESIRSLGQEIGQLKTKLMDSIY